MAADKVAVEQAIWTKKMYDVEIARNRPPCEDIGELSDVLEKIMLK